MVFPALQEHLASNGLYLCFCTPKLAGGTETKAWLALLVVDYKFGGENCGPNETKFKMYACELCVYAAAEFSVGV